MELAGLSLLQILGVGGAACGCVALLYLLRLHRRSVPVPFIGLWQRVLRDEQQTRLFSRLRQLASLLVALLVVALLALALGDPRRLSARAQARNRVLLIDAGLSMRATDVQPNRFARALQEAAKLLQAMGPEDHAMIALLGRKVTPLTPLISDRALLRQALQGLNASFASAHLTPGLRFAMDVLADRANPEVILISDGVLVRDSAVEERLLTRSVPVSYLAVGAGGSNIALRALAARPYPLDRDRYEVWVELHNPGKQARHVELTLYGDDRALEITSLRLEPDQRLQRVYRELGGARERLRARLLLKDAARDCLEADNEAFAVLPRRARTRVLAVSAGNRYLEAALLLDEYLQVRHIRPDEYRDARGYDVVILDRFVPEVAPAAPALYLRPEPRSSVGFQPLVVRGQLERPFFDRLERGHPLLRWVALRDVNVAEALRVEPEPPDHVVAADRRGPLIVSGTRRGQPFVALSFDPRHSDLPLRAAWPLLLLNVIDYLNPGRDHHQPSHEVGQVQRLSAQGVAKQLRLRAPDGQRQVLPVQDGRARWTPSQLGFYQSGEPRARYHAVNVDRHHDPQLAVRQELRLGPKALPAAVVAEEPTHSEVWPWLLYFATAVLLLEWFSYHRRWTV